MTRISIELQAPLIKRLLGFVDHLRLNGFQIGSKETRDVAKLLATSRLSSLPNARIQLKILLSGNHSEWMRFDDLFEAYWSAHGRERPSNQTKSTPQNASVNIVHGLWESHFSADQPEQDGSDDRHLPPLDGDRSEGSQGKLFASPQHYSIRTDFRKFVDPAEIAEAEQLAYRLAKAMRNRLSRRYRKSTRGSRLDFRKTLRANQCHGGEPLTLIKKRKPDRPVRIVVFLDVSGSMNTYSRFFLQFVKGLVCAWIQTDVYLFHTKLIRVTDTLRDSNAVKAMTQLSLITDGFGGGTKLGQCLDQFNRLYAKHALTSRSVILIFSDGYDTGTADHLANQLARLQRRAARLVWLNPMLGWRDYQPITAAMAAAMPHIDHFACANSIATLAAIEPELARL